jgi:hypothetical protein
MKLRNIKFRILIPVAYCALTLLPVVGTILTIAEGPNPFEFLWFLSEPGVRFLGFLDLGLGTRIRLLILVVFLANAVLYFLVGYLIDFVIKRRLTK